MAGKLVQTWVTAAVVVGSALGLSADTLYLRDGSRIDGELIRVSERRVEFREDGRRGRTIRVDVDDVRSIEFDRRGGGRPDWQDDRPGRPGSHQGMREREVVVSADVPWNDAGIDVRAGQSVYFEARGKVRWGKDREDGPDGENNSPHNPARPLPNRPGAALIGTVGIDSGDIFFIGADEGPFRVRNSGRLYLGINDDVLTDNRGNFRVTVFY
jgi:hypothetical protein